ncbi:MAG: ATP-dependent zinc metalloprotease FtsH [Chlorobiota bacterium]|nr:MAG: ATP-dependent zinc metalloprotease FtsH [Chlorobiota bacterium]
MFIAVMVIVMLVKGGSSGSLAITFNDYRKLLEAGSIEKVTVIKSQLNDYELIGELKVAENLSSENGNRKAVTKNFTTKLLVVDNEIQKEWLSKNINVNVQNESGDYFGNIVNVALLLFGVILMITMFRRMQQGGGSMGGKNIFSFGKSQPRVQNENSEKITFADVAGVDEAKLELSEVVDFLKEPIKFQKLGCKIPRGVLLLGPPGTGKTLLAKAVAGEAGVQFLSLSGADFVEMFVGVGASRVRDLFEQAKKVSPAIIFIDEIDAVGRQRGAGFGGGHDEREQTLNALLVEMDGFQPNTGIIVIAATNRPDVLDPALLRPGRFDRQVMVDLPDRKGREGILKVHTRNMPVGSDVNLERLALATPGFSGADIANLCNESAIHAARRGAKAVTMEDFEQARDKLIMGLERRSMIMSDEEKNMTSYHECGHVLVGKLMPEGDALHKVTIIPRGRALGVTSFLPEGDKHSRSKEWFESRIAMAMGGRAAELLIFGNYTSGAIGDIKQVTQLAKQMVCDLGMSDILGPVNYSSGDGEVFLGRDFSTHKDISEATATIIDQEVRRIVDEGMERATKILKENENLLHNMAKLLIEHETLDAEEIDMIVKGEEIPPLEVKKMMKSRISNMVDSVKQEIKLATKTISNPDSDSGLTPAAGV